MKTNLPYHFNAPDKLFDLAKELRHSQTPAEEFLWKFIRNRKVAGMKFRRQHPLGKYIADFYCYEAKLVIELDGWIHEKADIKDYDKERQEAIEEFGLKVLRFTNEDVFEDLEKIINEIIRNAGSSHS
jgi:very-short-patch-repair endonuclease